MEYYATIEERIIMRSVLICISKIQNCVYNFTPIHIKTGLIPIFLILFIYLTISRIEINSDYDGKGKGKTGQRGTDSGGHFTIYILFLYIYLPIN